MITPALGGLLLSFLFIGSAAVTKDEKWRLSYCIVGLGILFWSLGFFGLGGSLGTLLPGLTMLFGLFSFYAKGSAQLLSILITMVLLTQLFIF